MNMWSVKKTFRNCPMIGCYFDHCTCMHMCMHAHISVEQVLITNALLFSLNRTSPVVEVLKCERLANSSGSLRCPPMRWVKCVALYNRSAFTVNFDVINYHVTLLYGNVHNEFLLFRMAGTMFHRMHIPVSYFALQRIPFNVLWAYMSSPIPLVSEYVGKVNSCDVSVANTLNLLKTSNIFSFRFVYNCHSRPAFIGSAIMI